MNKPFSTLLSLHFSHYSYSLHFGYASSLGNANAMENERKKRLWFFSSVSIFVIISLWSFDSPAWQKLLFNWRRLRSLQCIVYANKSLMNCIAVTFSMGLILSFAGHLIDFHHKVSPRFNALFRFSAMKLIRNKPTMANRPHLHWRFFIWLLLFSAHSVYFFMKGRNKKLHASSPSLMLSFSATSFVTRISFINMMRLLI